jgi:hydroxymethylpyrimidine/phosphomethylpyrimidine kinase
MSEAPPVVLTVAGSDPSGGAGVQADLKTIHQHGGYGAAVATLITVQNTVAVEDVELLSPDLVRAQLSSLLGDVQPAAAKTGALGSPAVAHVLGSLMEETRFPWVVDRLAAGRFRRATW